MMHMHSFENDSVYLTLSETWHLFYILYFWVAYNTRNLTDKMHFWISHLVKFSWFLEPWVVSLQFFLQREMDQSCNPSVSNGYTAWLSPCLPWCSLQPRDFFTIILILKHHFYLFLTLIKTLKNALNIMLLASFFFRTFKESMVVFSIEVYVLFYWWSWKVYFYYAVFS